MFRIVQLKTVKSVDFQEIRRFSVKQRCFPMDSSLGSGSFVCFSGGIMPECSENPLVSLKSMDYTGNPQIGFNGFRFGNLQISLVFQPT